jgi:hypothetical protein
VNIAPTSETTTALEMIKNVSMPRFSLVQSLKSTMRRGVSFLQSLGPPEPSIPRSDATIQTDAYPKAVGAALAVETLTKAPVGLPPE